jgi:hypothetical protein
MAKESFNGGLCLAHAHRTTSLNEHADDGPLDHPIAEPERLWALQPRAGGNTSTLEQRPETPRERP